MARKPQPGGDRNAWGGVLNEFLNVSHETDGTIKPEGVQTAVATEVETALTVQLPPAVADAVAADSTVTAAAAAAIDAEPRVAQLVTDVAEVETVAAAAELYARVADNLVYNVMSPAKGPVAAGDGVTDDWAAIQHRLDNLPTAPNSARGGKVVLEPGREYGISQTLTITLPNTDLDGIVGGTLTTMGACTIKALPGFTGPLLRINIPAGSKGAWIRNLRLDGNGEPGVTAGVEYAVGTISVAHMFDVAIANVPIGINMPDYVQSIIFERVLSFYGVGIGVNIGRTAYHIIFDKCRIGGTQWGAIVGMDNNNSADHSENIIFRDSELYAMPGSNGCVLVRNAENTHITNCYVEAGQTLASPVTALIQLGTTNATARMPHIMDNRFGGNAKADYGVNIVNSVVPFIAFNGHGNGLNTAMVKETMLNTGGFIMGGPRGSTSPVFSDSARIQSTIKSSQSAGFDGMQFLVEGEAYPRVAVRNNQSRVYFGSGSAPPSVQVNFHLANILSMGTGDSFRVDGDWNGGTILLGNYRLWVDSSGKLRMKNGAPTSDTDGTVVGSQA